MHPDMQTKGTEEELRLRSEALEAVKASATAAGSRAAEALAAAQEAEASAEDLRAQLEEAQVRAPGSSGGTI